MMTDISSQRLLALALTLAVLKESQPCFWCPYSTFYMTQLLWPSAEQKVELRTQETQLLEATALKISQHAVT